MKKIVAWLIIFVLVGVSVFFSTLNLAALSLNFYFFTLTAPIAVFFFALIFFGALLGGITVGSACFGRRLELKKVKQKLAEREKELEALRKLPFKDSP